MCESMASLLFVMLPIYGTIDDVNNSSMIKNKMDKNRMRIPVETSIIRKENKEINRVNDYVGMTEFDSKISSSKIILYYDNRPNSYSYFELFIKIMIHCHTQWLGEIISSI